MEMKKYKLREVCDIIPGYAFKSSDFGHGNNIAIKIKDINPPEISFSNTDFVSYTPDSKFKLGKGDYVMAMTGATIGKIGLFNSDYENVYINQRVCTFKPKKGFDKKYLYYLLSTETFRQFVFSHVDSSSAQPNIGHPTLLDFEFFYPDLKKQTNIAIVLSSIDSKIALNNRINSKLEQMAKRLYDYWFVQFDFPGADGKPYKSNGGKMVWNEELKREIPEEWEVKNLGSLFTTNRGVSYSTATITGDDGIPMINLASFSPDGTYKISGLKKFTGEYTKEKVLKPYDLVLCNTQQTAIDFSKDIIGKVLLVPDIFEGDITSSHHVNTLHVCDEDLKFYLYRLCNTDYFHKYISNYASGTNILGLDFSGVENFKAEIPPAELLNQFAKLMMNIEKKKSEVIKENQKLTSMRDKLLPLLMNGQVVVE